MPRSYLLRHPSSSSLVPNQTRCTSETKQKYRTPSQLLPPLRNMAKAPHHNSSPLSIPLNPPLASDSSRSRPSTPRGFPTRPRSTSPWDPGASSPGEPLRSGRNRARARRQPAAALLAAGPRGTAPWHGTGDMAVGQKWYPKWNPIGKWNP